MGKKDKTQTRHVFQINYILFLWFSGDPGHPWTPNRLKSTGRVPVLDVRFAISRQAVRNIRNGKNE